MKQDASWASRVVDAVNTQFHEEKALVELVLVTAPTPVSIELVFKHPGDVHLRGMRLNVEAVRQGPERIRESSVDELAFDLIHMGICEPRALREFLPPDKNGIAWLPIDEWLDEV